MKIKFNNEDLNIAYEKNKERIQNDEEYLNKISKDIINLELFLRESFKKFGENFSKKINDNIIAIIKPEKGKKYRLSYLDDSSNYRPIIEAPLIKRLELYKSLPEFVNAITAHFYK